MMFRSTTVVLDQWYEDFIICEIGMGNGTPNTGEGDPGLRVRRVPRGV